MSHKHNPDSGNGSQGNDLDSLQQQYTAQLAMFQKAQSARQTIEDGLKTNKSKDQDYDTHADAYELEELERDRLERLKSQCEKHERRRKQQQQSLVCLSTPVNLVCSLTYVRLQQGQVREQEIEA